MTEEEFLEDMKKWNKEVTAIFRLMIRQAGYGWDDVFDPMGTGELSISDDILDVGDLDIMRQEAEAYVYAGYLVNQGLKPWQAEAVICDNIPLSTYQRWVKS